MSVSVSHKNQAIVLLVDGEPESAVHPSNGHCWLKMSPKELLVVMRFALSTPVNDTVRFPDVSYASSVKCPWYEFPSGFNVTFSVS